MIQPTYIDVKIHFESNDDLRWFLKESNWGQGDSLDKLGIELAVGYYLNMCRRHKKEKHEEDHCCLMDSGCIYVRTGEDKT